MTADRPRAGGAAQQARPLPLEIEPSALAALRSEPGSCALLDVREPWELAICGFREAIHCPLGALVGQEQVMPQDRPLIVICHTGRRSLLATQHLRRLGWSQAVNLRGGVEAYALEVDPSMARY
ncbi:MAG TPA: rhodanese-like domain-containing protein [Geminicoccaceae bacterium]|nr:rhodanese-like domain-containing protein [Geminicoccaceae bacterium]